tara:strand:- start:2516 stop:3034 length:519 start_codon:yes stop_codon:yes gene_type:complete
MSNQYPIIYISKRCPHCIHLLKIIQKRNDIKGRITIVSIDDEPFPDHITTVPIMIHGNDKWNAKEIFTMLSESAPNEQQQNSQQQQQNSQEGQCDSNQECSVDAYCSNGSCLLFSSIEDGVSDLSPTGDYAYIEGEEGPGVTQGMQDDLNNAKKSNIENDYDKLIQERNMLK